MSRLVEEGSATAVFYPLRGIQRGDEIQSLMGENPSRLRRQMETTKQDPSRIKTPE